MSNKPNFGKITDKAAAKIIHNNQVSPAWETTPEWGQVGVPITEQVEGVMGKEYSTKTLGEIIISDRGGYQKALDEYRFADEAPVSDIGHAALYWGDINPDGTLNK